MLLETEQSIPLRSGSQTTCSKAGEGASMKPESFLINVDQAVLDDLERRLRRTRWASGPRDDTWDFGTSPEYLKESGHPFLGRTLVKVLGNLRVNRFPYNVHAMTGPGAYTLAIKECLKETPAVAHRVLGVDYMRHLKFTYPMSKFFLYGLRQKNHWQTQRHSRPVIT
jgi:hypothetical protein